MTKNNYPDVNLYPEMNSKIIDILRTFPESNYDIYAAKLIESQSERIGELEAEYAKLKALYDDLMYKISLLAR